MVQRIVRAIVHEIPKGKYVAGAETQVECSSAEINLDPGTKRFIEDNIVNFGLKGPRAIVEDTLLAANTPNLVRSALASPDGQFVHSSQAIAQNLFASQTANSPSGILIVGVVADQSGESLLIMKAEHQEGIRLRKVGGTIDLEHLTELIVGNNSRVYKIAVLAAGPEGTLTGMMADQQNGDSFAAFFMSTFLGCRLADDAELMTKDFVNISLSHFTKGIPDEARRMRYVQALMAYIQTPSETFQAAEFADQFLEAEDRDEFVDSLPEELQQSVVSKNTALIPGRANGLKFYAPGVVVSANAIALERGDLEVLADDENSITFRLKGRVTRFGFGTAPRMAG